MRWLAATCYAKADAFAHTSHTAPSHISTQVIGKQWKSWSPYEDMHYRFELAGARQYAESPESVVTLGALDYYKAGTDGVVMVAHLDK